MPLQKLTRADLASGTGRSASRANPEYVSFLASTTPGDGGRAMVAAEGTTRQTVKNRLTAAANAAGVSIKFHTSGPDEVIFEVTEGVTVHATCFTPGLAD